MRNEVITFKVDATLLEAMKGIPNRSDFIRSAVLAALDGACPVCKGTGVLSPKQKKHLGDFLKGHSLEECDECREMHIVCHLGKKTKKKG